MADWDVHLGNNIDNIPKLDDESIRTVITSPPYFGLRNYGDGEGEIGLEETPEEFISNLCDVFDALKPKLTEDGTLWVNLGDTYASNVSEGVKKFGSTNFQETRPGRQNVKQPKRKITGYLKPKDLIGIPWMFAFEMRKRGWYLRQDIIWCLSGGVKVYARTPSFIGPISLKDLYQLNPNTVQLWNGEKWTQLLGMVRSSETDRTKKIEITLKSGEKINCTNMHQWPTNNGLKRAHELVIGDILDSCTLPDRDKKVEVLSYTESSTNRNEIVFLTGSEDIIFFDLSVADEPHLFSLASGVLTHNSKNNPMPESVTDRCTKAHEYIFLFSKSQNYHFDYEAIKEKAERLQNKAEALVEIEEEKVKKEGQWVDDGTRRKRSVWEVPVAAGEAIGTEHFATYPVALIEPCILAGSEVGDLVCDPFNGSGTTGVVSLKHDRNYVGFELYQNFEHIYTKRLNDAKEFNKQDLTSSANAGLFEW